MNRAVENLHHQLFNLTKNIAIVGDLISEEKNDQSIHPYLQCLQGQLQGMYHHRYFLRCRLDILEELSPDDASWTGDEKNDGKNQPSKQPID